MPPEPRPGWTEGRRVAACVEEHAPGTLDGVINNRRTPTSAHLELAFVFVIDSFIDREHRLDVLLLRFKGLAIDKME